MAYELREGKGNIFINDFKEKESHPDFTGDILYKGEVLRLAQWKKKTKDGKVYLSSDLQPKKADQPKDFAEKKYPPGDFRNMDDDIPF